MEQCALRGLRFDGILAFVHMKTLIALTCGLFLLALNLRADLAVTNFTTAAPIQIMMVGDSITDDCVSNGAWRLYLQPILNSNWIAYRSLGPYASTATPTFNQTHHEGYCGAVVAPPGKFPVHGLADTNNYLEYVVSNAFSVYTGAFSPNIFLILIGANDIGYGRDPVFLATNSMSTLLDMIYAKDPGANVILTKSMSLSNANGNLSSYANYATNVAIYGAALQAVVNHRRALGQNVFLADVFSAVDYATMYNPDHVHANGRGLAAIAREFATRIQCILYGTNQVTRLLIHGGDVWSFSDAGVDPPTNWMANDFDDSAWNSGAGRLGLGELIDESIVQPHVATYFRKKFVVPWNMVYTNLNFRLSQTGGAIVWLNGKEIYRTNMPAGAATSVTLATQAITGEPSCIYYPTTIPGTNLLIGTNVIAVEAHQAASGVQQGFDMELIGGAIVLSPPTISASISQQGVALSWQANNGATFALYSTGSLTAPNWQPANAVLQTNSSAITASIAPGPGSAFFRLQRSQ